MGRVELTGARHEEAAGMGPMYMREASVQKGREAGQGRGSMGDGRGPATSASTVE